LLAYRPDLGSPRGKDKERKESPVGHARGEYSRLGGFCPVLDEILKVWGGFWPISSHPGDQGRFQQKRKETPGEVA
jgi:hypothetical protein